MASVTSKSEIRTMESSAKVPNNTNMGENKSLKNGALEYHKFRTESRAFENENAVQVTNLCKGYNGPLVLNNFCMNVKKGTIYGLLGSSGCGKTTALSCIVGLKKWETGEILVFGQKPGTKESGIPGKCLGYVPQDIALYDTLSIKENIQYYGRLYGMSEGEILEQWELLVNLLQLPKDFKLVTNLSGGQRRRTSLSLALVHQPKLLILDEPTVGLDPLLRESVWEHLFKMVQTRGTTIIITTHYIEESRHSDRIGVMRHGRLLLEDSPAVLMAQHQTDLLEDVVLKACWIDSNKNGGHQPQNRHYLRNQTQSSNKESDDDNDSGTGTDNDINGRSNSNEDCSNICSCSGSSSSGACECENDSQPGSSNSVNDSAAVIQIVPSYKDNPKMRELRRSTSSDFAGVLFQSKWKPDECVLADDGPQGKYTRQTEFDEGPSRNAPNSHPQQLTRHSSITKSINGTKKLLSEGLEMTHRAAAFSCVIFLSLIRHPLFFVTALILPALEVLLTISSVGKEPRGLRVAVINDEMPDWAVRCPLDFGDSVLIKNLNSSTAGNNAIYNTGEITECNFNELSCKYLTAVSQRGVLELIPFNTTEEAELGVHKGDLWGYFHFTANYSQHMIDRLATKFFAFEETIDGSTISLKMDMSQYLGSILIIQHLFEGLQEYVQQLIGACDLGARQAEIPLHYRDPVYGEPGGNYHKYLIPGVLSNIMFIMPFAISAVMFIHDQKLGTSERAKVAGLKTGELMIAYAFTQGTIVIGQVIICNLCLKIGFNFEIEGSVILYLAITLLVGMCGQAFGLMVGIICRDEIEALIAALFILPTMLLFGGVIWPIHCMAPVWRYFGSTLPTTLITESLRSTSIRGVGITHALLWPGIVVTGLWLIVFWIVAMIAYRVIIR